MNTPKTPLEEVLVKALPKPGYVETILNIAASILGCTEADIEWRDSKNPKVKDIGFLCQLLRLRLYNWERTSKQGITEAFLCVLTIGQIIDQGPKVLMDVVVPENNLTTDELEILRSYTYADQE